MRKAMILFFLLLSICVLAEDEMNYVDKSYDTYDSQGAYLPSPVGTEYTTSVYNDIVYYEIPGLLEVPAESPYITELGADYATLEIPTIVGGETKEFTLTEGLITEAESGTNYATVSVEPTEEGLPAILFTNNVRITSYGSAEIQDIVGTPTTLVDLPTDDNSIVQLYTSSEGDDYAIVYLGPEGTVQLTSTKVQGLDGLNLGTPTSEIQGLNGQPVGTNPTVLDLDGLDISLQGPPDPNMRTVAVVTEDPTGEEQVTIVSPTGVAYCGGSDAAITDPTGAATFKWENTEECLKFSSSLVKPAGWVADGITFIYESVKETVDTAKANAEARVPKDGKVAEQVKEYRPDNLPYVARGLYYLLYPDEPKLGDKLEKSSGTK